MKNDRQIMERVRTAIDDCTRGIDDAPSLRYRILQQAKGEAPVKNVKKKWKTALALSLAMLLLAGSALAITLTRSDTLNWLFGKDADVPQEAENLLNQPGEEQTSETVALTLNETLFDGKNLTAALTLKNTTGEQLIYVVHHARLDGEPLFAETALLPYGGDYGKVMGGSIEGEAISTETKVIATFNATTSMGEKAEADTIPAGPVHTPLQAKENAQLSLRVDVYRPAARLAFLQEGEYLAAEAQLAPSVMAVERDSHLVLTPGNLLMEKVDSKAFTFTIHMQKAAVTTVKAAPGVYEGDKFSLQVERLELSAISGTLEATVLVPYPGRVDDSLPEDLSFFLVFPEETWQQAKEKGDASLALRLAAQSGAEYWSANEDEVISYDVAASFRANMGPLPRGVYLVWYTSNHGTLDWNTAIHVPLQ